MSKLNFFLLKEEQTEKNNISFLTIQNNTTKGFHDTISFLSFYTSCIIFLFLLVVCLFDGFSVVVLFDVQYWVVLLYYWLLSEMSCKSFFIVFGFLLLLLFHLFCRQSVQSFHLLEKFLCTGGKQLQDSTPKSGFLV